MGMKEYTRWYIEHSEHVTPKPRTGIDKLLRLYTRIPPRGPRGSPEAKSWGYTTREFEKEARRQGIEPVEAYRLCRGKKVGTGSPEGNS